METSKCLLSSVNLSFVSSDRLLWSFPRSRSSNDDSLVYSYLVKNYTKDYKLMLLSEFIRKFFLKKSSYVLISLGLLLAA